MSHLQTVVIVEDESRVHQGDGEIKQDGHQHQQDEKHGLNKPAILFMLPQIFQKTKHHIQYTECCRTTTTRHSVYEHLILTAQRVSYLYHVGTG